MSNNTYPAKETSFWKFIQENEIEIPIIQRDYAQGRLGKEILRKNFLVDLKKALDNEIPYKDKAMKMDFVYGSVEQEIMNPLDGQQRLTTLWLLHWYIALRAGELNDEVADTLNKFSYETRISSREFCSNLCQSIHFKDFDGKDIVGFITKQTWFYSAWKQDPTIQSVLRMLGGTKVKNKKGEDIVDGLEELFEETNIFNDYWKKLISENAPIVFYHLPLKDFGLSDDLYIKMNARGKQLTSFENFKADLVDYITEQSDSELLDESTKKKWKSLLDEQDGILIKMDTTWIDIFWDNRSKDSRVDEIYFAFLNRFFWDKLFMYKNGDNYVLDIGKGDETSTQENNNPSYKYLNNSHASQNVYDTTISYKELDVYKFFNGEIPYDVFKDLQIVLNRYRNTKIPVCQWEDSFRFVPTYEKDSNGDNVEITDTSGEKILKVTYLNQVQRIVFHAVCKYFIEGEADETSLKQWMRVVWNLVSEEEDGRYQIRSTSAIRTAIEFIDKLNSHDVYSSLRDNIFYLGTSSFDKRCKEEIAKAKQILADAKWEKIIISAEEYAFFKGSIRFLFTDGNGKVNWDDFNTKWTNAQKYFDKRGVKDSYENKYKSKAILLKAVLFHVEDFWKYIEPQKFVLDNNVSTWKKNILLGEGWEKAVHNILMGNLSLNQREEDCLMYKNLYQTELLDYVANKQEDSRIRWIHDHRAVYPPRYEGIMLDDDCRDNPFYRNQILSDLLSINSISSDQNLHCGFFKGWDINFQYSKKNFQWNRNDKVYIMENNDRKKKADGDEYFFSTKTITNYKDFITRLNKLIEDAYKKEE